MSRRIVSRVRGSVSRPINYHDRSQLTPFGTSFVITNDSQARGREGLVGSLHGENKLHVFVLAKVIVKQLNKLVN